jgi:hypothetical protein
LASVAASPTYDAGVSAFSRAFSSAGSASPSMNAAIVSRVMARPRVSAFSC